MLKDPEAVAAASLSDRNQLPLDREHTTARMQAEAERSLADEAGRPLAQLMAIPQDGGTDEEGNPLAELRARHSQGQGEGVVNGNHGGRLGRGSGGSTKKRLAGRQVGAESTGKHGGRHGAGLP